MKNKKNTLSPSEEIKKSTANFRYGYGGMGAHIWDSTEPHFVSRLRYQKDGKVVRIWTVDGEDPYTATIEKKRGSGWVARSPFGIVPDLVGIYTSFPHAMRGVHENHKFWRVDMPKSKAECVRRWAREQEEAARPAQAA